MVEASTRRGLEGYFLDQHMDGQLDSVDSLQIAARVCQAVIPSEDEALSDSVAFAFLDSHLFYSGGVTCSSNRGPPLSH